MRKMKQVIFLRLMFNIQKFNELHSDLPFLLGRKKLGNAEKPATSLEDKCEYVVHIKSLKRHQNMVQF